MVASRTTSPPPPADPVHPKDGRWLTVCALILATVASVFDSPGCGSRLAQGERALAKAFARRRPIEPRLSGGLAAGRFDPSASQDQTDIDIDSLNRARDLIPRTANRDDSAATQLSYGRLLLLDGGPAKAEERLARAVSGLSKSAEAHNDYGACLFVNGKFEAAVEQLDEALKLRPRMPEALFNRALCYQRLMLREAAASDLTDLKSIEHDPGWQREIGERLSEASQPFTRSAGGDIAASFDSAAAGSSIEEAKHILGENFQLIFRHAVRILPRRMLEAIEAGNNDKAEAILSELELIGRLSNDVIHDEMISGVAARLRMDSPAKRRVDLESMKDCARALDDYDAGRMDAAASAFEQLNTIFAARLFSEYELITTYKIAECRYLESIASAALSTVMRAYEINRTRKWPYLGALIRSDLSLYHAVLDQDSVAIRYANGVVEFAKETRMGNLEFTTLQFLGLAYARLGDLDAALQRFRESLDVALGSPVNPKGVAYSYLHMADIYRLLNNHTLALAYARQSLSLCRASNDADYGAQAASLTAVEHSRLGQPEEAKKAMEEARAYIQGMDQTNSAFARTLVFTREGEVSFQQGDIQTAISSYTSAQKLSAAVEGQAPQLVTALQRRAEAYAKGGDFDKALADLNSAVGRIENRRAGIAERRNQGTFVDMSYEAFDELISLNVRRGINWYSDAFDASERARGRTLLDEYGISKMFRGGADGKSNVQSANRSVPARTLDQIREGLPLDLTILAYSVTSDGTFASVVRREGFVIKTLAPTTETLDQLVHQYLSDLRSQAPLERVNEEAKRLYDLLVAPVEGDIEGVKRICILPDKALNLLPFAALMDGSGRYVAETRRITYAPSASVLVRCVEAARARPKGTDENLLAVGDPTFDPKRFVERLQPLDDAVREVNAVREYYSRASLVLTGPEATETRISAALQTCDVAHLSVHTLVSEKTPWLAAIILASPTGESDAIDPGGANRAEDQIFSATDGLMYLEEIYKLRLLRARLVVLAACQSGLGKYYRGEGMVSLVRPFLAARVPLVVASLWPVDSRATADLMIDFHRRRRIDGERTSEALRNAQSAMAGGPPPFNHPYYWAAFIAVGSDD